MRTEPVVGLSLGPARRKPVVVGFSYVFVDITAKFFPSIGAGTNIEVAFIDEKGRWIAILQFAFAHVISAKPSILRNIFGRILAKRDFAAKHHPGQDYRMAAGIGVGVNKAYPTITVTALDIATYIQNRDRSIPWNVCRTAGEYMETWVNYSRLGFDPLSASEILFQGVSNGLNGKIK